MEERRYAPGVSSASLASLPLKLYINVYAVHPWSGFEEFVRQRVLSVSGHLAFL